jgi:hypothetical protein
VHVSGFSSCHGDQMNIRQKLAVVIQSAAVIACTAGVIKFPH